VSTSGVQFAGSNGQRPLSTPRKSPPTIPASDRPRRERSTSPCSVPRRAAYVQTPSIFTGEHPLPTTTRFHPRTRLSVPPFTLTVNGDKLRVDSVVQFAGSARTTTFVNRLSLRLRYLPLTSRRRERSTSACSIPRGRRDVKRADFRRIPAGCASTPVCCRPPLETRRQRYGQRYAVVLWNDGFDGHTSSSTVDGVAGREWYRSQLRQATHRRSAPPPTERWGA